MHTLTRILLIEDSPLTLAMIHGWLRAGLQFEYELQVAETLQSAEQILHSIDFDVIVLDLNLPDSDGLPTFNSIQLLVRETPIVILSGESDQHLAIEAVRRGAQDYIVKGQTETNPLARSIQFALERSRRQQAEVALQSSENQIAIAQSIQQRLLPPDTFAVDGFELSGKCDSVDRTGGDYFDFFLFPDQSLGVVLADVCGHGIGSAMLMVETRAILRALAQSEPEPGNILSNANKLLTGDLLQGGFVTLFIAKIQPQSPSLSFASAGHPGYLIDNLARPLALRSQNVPLGVMPNERYDTHDAQLQCGDLLYIASDGISEASADNHHFFGEEHALRAVVSNRDRPAREILAHLFAAAAKYTLPATAADDRTAVLVRRL